MKFFLKLLWIIGLLLLIAEKCFATAGKDGPQISGFPPSLVLQQSVQGPALSELTWEKFKGKVVVLEFWDTSCGPCVQAIPHWNELVEKFSSQPVIFLSITDDNPEPLKNFLKIKPMKGWMAIDDPFGSTRTAFGVTGIPHTVLIDKLGKIVATTHPISLKAKHLEELLADQQTSIPPPKIDADEEPVKTVSAPTRRLFEISINGPFSHPKSAYNFAEWNETREMFTANKAYLPDALGSYFGFEREFVISDPTLPKDLYDIIVCGPTNKSSELQSQFVAAFQVAFGFDVKTNRREMKVYEMTFANTNAPNLRVATSAGGGGGTLGGFKLGNSTMESVASSFADTFKMPVINETRSTNLWEMKIGWKMTVAENLPYTIYRQVGRELAEKVLDDSDMSQPDAKILQAVREKISAEDFVVLETELKKPADERFRPDPTNVVEAAREQLGLRLTLTNRIVPVLEITKKQVDIH
ncbi:MAG: TlpA disulfide reductase family protein [Verrucomicrobiota bacterium]